MITTGIPFQRALFDHQTPKVDWNGPYGSDEQLSPSSLTSSDQYVLFQEHARLNQYTPPPSPHIYSSRPAESMRPYSAHLMPGPSQYTMGAAHRGHRRTVSAGAASSVASPNASTPGTPRLSDHQSGTRPTSECASSHDNSPFTPQSPYDVDFPTGLQLHIDDPPIESSFQDPSVYAEFYGGGIGDLSTDTYGIASTDSQMTSADDFSEPPYPDPDGIANAIPTVNPYLVEAQLHPAAPFSAHYPLGGVSYDQAQFDGNMSSVAATPTDQLAGRIDEALSLPDDVSAQDEDSSDDTHRADDDASGSLNAANETASTSMVSSTSSRGSNRRQVAMRWQYNKQRSAFQCDHCKSSFDTETRCKKHMRKFHEFPYLCIFHAYGCKEVFGTKNEWVRHVRVQHLRLETWRCELESCGDRGTHETILPRGAKRTNDYGRKDLFLEHVRRIHKVIYQSRPEGPQRKEHLNDLQRSHRLDLRSPPTLASCPCCQDLWNDFDAWIEHIAKNMETNKQTGTELCDPHLQDWMINEGLLEWLPDQNHWRLEGADGKRGGRQSRQHRLLEADAPADSDEDEEPARAVSRRNQPRRQRKQDTRHRRRQSEPSRVTTRANAYPPLVPSQRC